MSPTLSKIIHDEAEHLGLIHHEPLIINPTHELTQQLEVRNPTLSIPPTKSTTTEVGITSVETKAASSMTNIVTQIANGAVTLWKEVEADIEADIAKIKAALPSSAAGDLATVAADVKQGASDTITLVTGSLAGIAPSLTSGLEKELDAAIGTVSNGLALPLVPLVNSGIESLENLAISTIQAWALKTKASLTTNTSTKAQ